MWQWLIDVYGNAHQWVFEAIVQPIVFGLGMGNFLEDAFRGTGWLVLGLAQVGVIATVFHALQRWRPVEPVVDKAAVRVDVLYSLIHRLGLFRLGLFFTLEPLADTVAGQLRLWGWHPWQLDSVWPGVTDQPVASFVIYLVLFDAVDYFIHRGQHAWQRWWALHALHHSQRQMTMWSDNRNHLLDDLLRDAILVAVAQAVGIAPGQFIAVVACTQLLESLSHANVRLTFGPVLGRLLVSPMYHRRHHAIGEGHEGVAGRGSLGGCNYAVLFPVWDVLFRTARLEERYEPTGIRDQLPAEGGRDYGRGFWAQQWLGLVRLARGG